MADQKHLEILRKGVEFWNQWRDANHDIVADLNHANFNHANLQGVNFFRVHLDHAELNNANLETANFFRAHLRHAKLIDANLRHAKLIDVNLCFSKLNRADLTYANFFIAQLDSTIFSGANLYRANLYRANLYRAHLTGVDLENANLGRTILNDANLQDANLISADLTGVDLENANLKGANLYYANLSRVQALATNFSGAVLTGVCIEDWNINSKINLKDVICDYVYLKKNQKDRRPHDPNKIFARKEFIKRYQKILETVDIYFEDGIDWQAFLVSFNKLQIECGSDELSINSFENKGNGAFVIRVNVPDGVDKAEIEKYLKKQYQLEATVEAQQRELTNLYKVTELLAGRTINVTNQASGNTYNTEKAGIVHNEGDISGNAKIAAVINEAAQQDLTQAAAEIQQLLEQLAKDNPTETTAEKMMVGAKVVEEIEKDPTLKQRIINALKAMTVEAFMEAIDHPLANVVRAGIEGYREP